MAGFYVLIAVTGLSCFALGYAAGLANNRAAIRRILRK